MARTMTTPLVTLTLSTRTVEALMACVETVAADEREPERYRQWYEESARELREAVLALGATDEPA